MWLRTSRTAPCFRRTERRSSSPGVQQATSAPTTLSACRPHRRFRPSSRLGEGDAHRPSRPTGNGMISDHVAHVAATNSCSYPTGAGGRRTGSSAAESRATSQTRGSLPDGRTALVCGPNGRGHGSRMLRPGGIARRQAAGPSLRKATTQGILSPGYAFWQIPRPGERPGRSRPPLAQRAGGELRREPAFDRARIPTTWRSAGAGDGRLVSRTADGARFPLRIERLALPRGGKRDLVPGQISIDQADLSGVTSIVQSAFVAEDEKSYAYVSTLSRSSSPTCFLSREGR